MDSTEIRELSKCKELPDKELITLFPGIIKDSIKQIFNVEEKPLFLNTAKIRKKLFVLY